MADWFDFKGIRSTSLGVYVTEFPPIPIAVERAEYKEIPGRAGALTIREGEDVYEDVTFSVSCFIADLNNLSAIAEWLNGYGKLVLGNRPDRARKARVSKQIDVTRLLRARDAHTFDVTFRCDPFWYEAEPDTHRLVASSTLFNEGTVSAEPEITVVGQGNVILDVGSTSLQIADLSGSIIIDSGRKIAYWGNTSLAYKLTGDWPKLSVGSNMVNFPRSATLVTVTPNWRWL